MTPRGAVAYLHLPEDPLTNQRQQMLLIQATTDVMAALGAGQMRGDNSSAGPDCQRGVILAFADSEDVVIHSETYWMEGDRQRFRYRLVAKLQVEREAIDPVRAPFCPDCTACPAHPNLPRTCGS